MSKLPNHAMWTRAATTSAAASSSSRATSVLAKTQHHRLSSSQQNGTSHSSYAQASQNALQPHTTLDANTLAAMGAVSAPYYGPQPAAVVDVFEQQNALAQSSHYNSQTQEASVSSSSSSSLALTFPNTFTSPISFPQLASLSHSLLTNAAFRNASAPSVVMHSPRPVRSMHHWSQSPNSSSSEHAGSSRRAITHTPTTPSRKQGKTRLLFDIGDASSLNSSNAKGKGVSRMGGGSESEVDAVQQMEKIDELLVSLFPTRPEDAARVEEYLFDRGANDINKSEQNRGWTVLLNKANERQSVSFTPTNPLLWHDAKAPLDKTSVKSATTTFTNNVPPSYSRSPSPGPSSGGTKSDIGHRSPFGHVSEPPAKFAVTTSAQAHVTPSTSGDGSGGATSSLQSAAATTYASQMAGSSSAPPSQAPSPASQTDHWAKTFNIPRSAKRHDFMFEHGAYGIPKRHPLSSIRSAPISRTGKSERSTPSQDEVPSGKVKAAADMLSAAAEFLAGSRSASKEHAFTPFKGDDALQAALAGGSTAQEYELRAPVRSGDKTGKDGRSNGVHRMAIRGPDGRIIKERLRSVQVGEDAYFLRPDALGVADGVGGWASRPGADPALFSRLLMHFCAVELSRYDGLSASELAADNGSMLKAWASVDPVEVMHRAWERCVRASRREGILGSSTALLGLLRGDELRIANMGDCVLMIIRRGEMMFRSTEQQHSFNFPVQLGMMGDTTDTIKKHVMATQEPRERAAAEGEVSSAALDDYDAVEGESADSSSANAPASRQAGREQRSSGASAVQPESEGGEDVEPEWDEPRRDAGRWTVRVEAGDIIVVGSDGLMDNLFDEDIIEEVLRFLPLGYTDYLNGRQQDHKAAVAAMAANFSPQLVSEALCSRAKAVSEDSRAISSPFQQRAMEEGLNYVGGKHDDISVVVCLVGERDTLDFGTTDSSSASTSDGEGEGGENGVEEAEISAASSDSEAATPSPSSNASSQKFLIK